MLYELTMVVLGGIAFTLIALVILALFMSEYNKEQGRKVKQREELKEEIERAMERKDVTALKRIRLLNASTLEEIDGGLGQRIGEFTDELYIEQDDAKKLRSVK